MDSDGDLLKRATQIPNFFGSVLTNDSLDDWTLARDLGKFLVRLHPEEIMGHALQARAYRHLGDSERALAALEQCRSRVPHPAEQELFRAFMAEEESFLNGTSPSQM